jgi:hypothetical protein
MNTQPDQDRAYIQNYEGNLDGDHRPCFFGPTPPDPEDITDEKDDDGCELILRHHVPANQVDARAYPIHC